MEFLGVALDCVANLFPDRTVGFLLLGIVIGLVIGFYFGIHKNDGKMLEMIERHHRELRESDIRSAEELRRASERHHDELSDLRKRAGARIARIERELASERDPTGKVALMGLPKQGEWDSCEDDEDDWL